jgi:hypothetical protein
MKENGAGVCSTPGHYDNNMETYLKAIGSKAVNLISLSHGIVLAQCSFPRSMMSAEHVQESAMRCNSSIWVSQMEHNIQIEAFKLLNCFKHFT